MIRRDYLDERRVVIARHLSNLILVAAIVAFAATQVFAQAPVGLKWKPISGLVARGRARHDAAVGLKWKPTSGNYTYTKVPGGDWVQTSREGHPLWSFIEVQSNETFVEIATKSRKWSYRLYHGFMMTKTPGEREWVPGDPGDFE